MYNNICKVVETQDIKVLPLRSRQVSKNLQKKSVDTSLQKCYNKRVVRKQNKL